MNSECVVTQSEDSSFSICPSTNDFKSLQAIDNLALALATQTDASFFHALCHELLALTQSTEVLILAIDQECPGQLKIISHVAQGVICLTGEIHLNHTPFEKLARQGRQKIGARLGKFFPAYVNQLTIPAESFYGVTFYGREDRPIGYLALHYLHPLTSTSLETLLIDTFDARISAELERRRDHEALQLSAVAFETREGIVITDPYRQILRTNAAFSRITGYEGVDVLGKSIEQVFKGIEADLFSGQDPAPQHQGEFTRERRCGTQYPQWETLTPVTNSQNVITHYVVCFEDVSKRKEAEAQIQNLAFYDALTGLLNRRKLGDELDNAFHYAKKHEQIGALLFLDLDHFKNINDSLGHAAGDWILQQVSSRLKKLVRQGDLLARLGGDEFVLLLPNLGGNPPQAEQQANLIGQRLIQDISAPYLFEGQALHVGTSVGISLFPAKGQQPSDLLKQADTAMYRAKSAGRRTLVFFEPSMQTEVDNRLQTHNALRHALEHDELELHYQPQHVVATGELIGAEALVRWHPPGRGLVLPSEFIPIAEETDLIIDIGLWVLREGCRHFVQWRKQGLKIPSLSINVSAKQFHDSEFVSHVIETINSCQMDPLMLNLEITESVVLNNAEEAIAKMEELKALGISFSIDDFGSGYSSLAYLKRLPADELKIDRTFIRDIPMDHKDIAIVDAVLAIAAHLGFTVMAEGVESRLQLDFLKQRGCGYYQGFFASKPLNYDSMTRYISGK